MEDAPAGEPETNTGNYATPFQSLRKQKAMHRRSLAIRLVGGIVLAGVLCTAGSFAFLGRPTKTANAAQSQPPAATILGRELKKQGLPKRPNGAPSLVDVAEIAGVTFSFFGDFNSERYLLP